MTAGSASAPGSSANLGPGFDVLAIAWEIRCHVTVTPAAEWRISQGGEMWTPRDGEFVKRAAQAAGSGPFLIEIENEVPRSRGLGSSSAVATAVAAAAFRAGGVEPSDEELLAIVAGLDGHPDNAAAAVHGGLVLVDGLNYTRLPIAPDLRFLAAIPVEPLRTPEARAALPPVVDRKVVVRSLARFGYLLRGLHTGDAGLLAHARGDELHEKPRDALSPLSGRLISVALEAGALHASWSGAGPTVLVIASSSDMESIGSALDVALEGAGVVADLTVADQGWL